MARYRAIKPTQMDQLIGLDDRTFGYTFDTAITSPGRVHRLLRYTRQRYAQVCSRTTNWLAGRTFHLELYQASLQTGAIIRKLWLRGTALVPTAMRSVLEGTGLDFTLLNC